MQYDRGLDYYRKRIDAIQFTGHNQVLDIACGCGQWAVALNECNHQVVGVDYSPGLLEIAKAAAQFFRQDNLQFTRGDFHALPFPSGSFDAAICYSAIYIHAHEPTAIREMCRILKSGGRLYLVSDGAGWPFYNLWVRGIQGKRFRSVLKAMKLWLLNIVWQQGLRRYGRYYSYLTEREVRKFLTTNNMEIEFFGADGEYGNAGGQAFQPLYGKRFLGLPSDFEVLAVKRSV